MNSKTQDFKRQNGFSLIELLIAILILAVGLLGVAAMQTYSVKATSNSNLRGIALYLANNMADRIRANRQGFEDGDYDSMAGAAQVAACLTAAGCSPQEMANNDKWEWQQTVQTTLPGGGVALGTAAGVHSITVTWIDRVKQGAVAGDTGTDTSTLVLRTQL